MAIPVLVTPFPDSSIIVGTNYLLDLAGAFTDENSVTATGLPLGSGLIVSPGRITGSANSTDLAATPITVTVTATGSSGTTVDDFIITVLPAMEPPLLSKAFADARWTVGEVIALDLGAGFRGERSISVSGLPVGTGLAVAASQLTGTVNAADFAAQPLTITVTAENAGGTTADSFSALVGSAPSAPVLTAPFPDVEWIAGQAVDIALGQSFTGETSATATGLPVGTGLSVISGRLSGAVSTADLAAQPLTITVTATNTAGTTVDSFIATVLEPVGDPPVLIAPLPNVAWTQWQAVAINLGEAFTGEASVTVSGLPVGSGLSLTLGQLAGTVNEIDLAATPITLTVTAGNTGGTAVGTFIATVSVPVPVGTGVAIVDPSRMMVADAVTKPKNKVFMQDALDDMDYVVDFSLWFEPGDIVSAAVSVSGDAEITKVAFDSQYSMVGVFVGAVSDEHVVEVTAVGSNGRKKNYGFYVVKVDS